VSFAEKEGTFVNHAGLAQMIHWAVAPPDGCRADGQVFLDLLERRGLVHAPTLRAELAREVPFFAPLTRGGVRSGRFRLLLFLVALLVAATGYFGGFLVYGEDYFNW
jgi:hypothetical protein